MKILFVSHSAALLGAERSLLEIATGAVQQGHSVTVVVPEVGPLVAQLQGIGADVRVLPVPSWMGPRHWLPPVGALRLWQIRRSVGPLGVAIHAISPDLIVSNSATVAAPTRVARRLGIPHVWIIRESIRDNRQLRSLAPKRVIARAIALDSVVCVVSDYVHEQLSDLAGLPSLRTQPVRPNPAHGIARSEKMRIHWGTQRATVLLPGFFSPEKGQHLAILAAHRARLAGVPFDLRIVGRGGRLYSLFLRILVIVLGLRSSVAFVPWQNSLSGEYERAHFVLTTSQNEAYGRSVVEALAFGIPVIGFRRGGTAELLEGGGGILVDACSGRALGADLVRILAIGEDEYLDLVNKALVRGDKFRESPTQYELFSRVVSSLR